MSKTLDLGCGLRPKNPFDADEVFGIDVRDDIPANIRSADLALEAIPFDSNFFDYVTAHDFLEHIPRVLYSPQRRNSFVELMNEIYRVLKLDGLFLSLTPAYPYTPAFRDPTHVNIITEDTFSLYFDDQKRWASAYGFNGAFKISFQEWRGAHLLTVMRKVLLPEPDPATLNVVQDQENALNSALEYWRQGQNDEAVKLLWQIHTHDPGDPVPLFHLSRIMLQSGNHAEAVRISEHGIKVEPLYIPLRVVYGDILQALGRMDEALQSYDKALEIHPNYVRALMSSGLLLKNMQRHQEALTRFSALLAVEPANATALENHRLITATLKE